MFDGYAISIPGSIIANPGFVEVFATLEIGGVPTLDPTYVGVWTGMTSAGQLIGMLGGPFACDRFGRRFGMVLLSVMLLIVSDPSIWRFGVAKGPNHQGIILEIVSKDWKVFLAARIFAGIGTGLVQSGITVYISEIA
jgi:MFS family permease